MVQQSRQKVIRAHCSNIYIGVVGFCIIPLIKTWCCIWPRVKPGEPISCTKKPCCWYFHFWKNESTYIYLHYCQVGYGVSTTLGLNELVDLIKKMTGLHGNFYILWIEIVPVLLKIWVFKVNFMYQIFLCRCWL